MVNATRRFLLTAAALAIGIATGCGDDKPATPQAAVTSTIKPGAAGAQNCSTNKAVFWQRGKGGKGKGGKGGEEKRGGPARRKVCRFCADKNVAIDYKDPQTLKYFITDRGKIIPRRISGNCARHQRKVSVAIKRARMIALMPFAVTGA